MIKIISSLFALLLFISPAHAAASINLISDKRIVGGELVVDNIIDITPKNTTAIEQWPWIVALKSDGEQFCGASLINRQWILTAAHCVYDPSSNTIDTNLEIQAVFLQSNLNQSNTQSFTRNISEIHIHPEYSYNLDLNDIALLKLDKTVDNINPILLPGSSYDAFTIAAGTQATVLGWGLTQETTDDEVILRKVELPITEQAVCSQSMAKNLINIEDSMICAGYPEGGKDACSGDSGGPLVYFSDPLQNWVQVGIVSFGIGCALADEYGVYTRISKYTQPQQLINTTICETFPEIPALHITQEKQIITINFSTQKSDKHFRLYYAPYPGMTPIKYIDILGNQLSATLAKGETYFIAAQTRDVNCISPFSEIQVINL
jgi:secreted trypsin-like serine protease